METSLTATDRKKKLISKKQKRRLVKDAMVVSMATLFITGFNKSKGSRKLHVAAGVALAGLSIYHNFLYPDKMKS